MELLNHRGITQQYAIYATRVEPFLVQIKNALKIADSDKIINYYMKAVM